MHVAVGLSPTSPLRVVTAGSCVFELVSPAPATATNDASDLRFTPSTQTDELVVKFQTLLLANAVPAVSCAPVVIVAVYAVLPASGLDGAKLATCAAASYVTAPATEAVPGPVSVKLAASSVCASIAVLNVALICAGMHRPTRPAPGFVAVTVGAAATLPSGMVMPPSPRPPFANSTRCCPQPVRETRRRPRMLFFRALIGDFLPAR